MSVYIKGMTLPASCHVCVAGYGGCFFVAPPEADGVCPDDGRADFCPLIPVPDHGGLFDVNQFEKGCFYGYGHDGRVYKLFWDERVFDGAKKFYIHPIISEDEENEP